MELSPATSFAIPDLPSYFKYSLRRNQHEKIALRITKNWFFQGCQDKKFERAKAQYDVDNFAFLASTCYPEADKEHMQTCSDFLILLFHLDDITDEMTPIQSDSTADIVMKTLRNPHGYSSPTRVGFLIKECVLVYSRVNSISLEFLLFPPHFQLLDTIH